MRISFTEEELFLTICIIVGFIILNQIQIYIINKKLSKLTKGEKE
jgi:hypothetical protein